MDWHKQHIVVLAIGSALLLVSCESPTTPAGAPVDAQFAKASGAPPAALGIWIDRAELKELPVSRPNHTGLKELRYTADARWTVQGIEQLDDHVYNLQVMAGALEFARLYPRGNAERYRQKVVQAIRTLISLPDDPTSSVTGPNRFLGTWAITADLINLPAHDPVLDRAFRAWLQHKLDYAYESDKTVRTQMGHANNQGAWACFSLAAASAYLGDRATLDQLAIRMRRWLGDTSVPFTLKWTDEQDWQLDPSNPDTWVGINPKGATRDGHNFDGIQPSDQNRGTPAHYDPLDFPNDYSDVGYIETSLHGALGAVLILHRAGYTDLIDASDQALLRAAQWISYATDTFPQKGYHYFTTTHESAQPLIHYFYPRAQLPNTRARTKKHVPSIVQAYGYDWTSWTHGSRSVR